MPVGVKVTNSPILIPTILNLKRPLRGDLGAKSDGDMVGQAGRIGLLSWYSRTIASSMVSAMSLSMASAIWGGYIEELSILANAQVS